MKKEIVVILHNIRSEQNVGSIFRTSDAAGVSKIYLTGYTPAPLDKFGRKAKGIAKTALGAEEFIAWEKLKTPASLFSKLKKSGFKILAIEQDKKAVDYKKIKIGLKTAFVFGNEVEGISKSLLQKVDEIAFIPMKGRKESLNVSVSAGIALFRILGI
ncbi:MAG: TrmH family RNA methyltransferase [Candidatus Pacebacteria bacterium]|nr:TrmH family RNA methyltransferase [Candidatus Paceibacterota bacterium]MDD5356849.1 TrmH family RNA methyltransferase [Candidatus Paceibacterota bacterium]